MKQSFAFAAFTSFALSVSGLRVHSQDAWATASINPTRLVESSKNLLASEEADRKAIESIKGMNNKMFTDFQRHYSNATNIVAEVIGDCVMIHFNQDNVKTRVCYSNKGRWMSTLKYLKAEQLPADIVEAVNDYYPRYEVTRGQEIRIGAQTAWLIDLENKFGYKTIRLLDGEMDVYREYQKQD